MKTAVSTSTKQEPDRRTGRSGVEACSTIAIADHRASSVAQRRIGEAIQQSACLVAQRKQVRRLFGAAAQLKTGLEEELQKKAAPDAIQRMKPEEELQKKADPAVAQRMKPEEELQKKVDPAAIQRMKPEEELTQGKFAPTASAVQLQDGAQAQPNRTGLPDHLKSGIEHLSGLSMDNVRVHYNSPKPAQLQALAYTQGTDIHVGPGQEQHVPHEAWHVVQQAQGRVQPTMQMQQGIPVNDDASLEHEADVMGQKAKFAS